MRRIVMAAMSTISGLVLLFGYHTSTNSRSVGAATATADATTDDGMSRTTPSSGASSDPSASSNNAAGPAGSSADLTRATYTGSAVDTRWGTVQVQITVVGGRITESLAVQYPQGNGRDFEINSYALPQLAHEVLAAQSGSIDAVSGATVTSDGYIQSLQSALDEAHQS